MINTIFYFVDTENEYQNKYRAGDIKPYTIALARDTKSIWKDGIRYGGLNQQEVDTIVSGSEDEINTLIDQINNTIDEINDKVSEEKDRLDGVIRDLDGNISDKVSDMISDSQFIQQNFPQGVVTWQNGWNDKVQQYLQSVGLWDYEQDGSIVTKWSTIRQSINNITSQVNSISDGIDGHVNSLQSQITQEVNDRNEAITTISNTYANSVEDVNGIKEVIEWMYSGLTSSASEDLSYAEIVAAGKNGMNSAISDLRAEVESIGDTYVAKSSLTSSVNDSLTGIINEATGTSAGTTIFSKINTNSSDLAAIATKITGDTSQASVSAKLNGMTASLVTTANVDQAIAGLSAQGKNNVAATIFAQANENGSTITLDADQINLEGQTTFDTAIGNKIDARIANANVITQSNLEGEVEAILEGGNATFDGDVIANTLTAGDTEVTGLNIHTTGNEIQFRQGDEKKAYFVANGGGLQLYIKDENGDWKCIDFTNWSSVQNQSTDYTPITYYDILSTARASQRILYRNETDHKLYDSPKSSASLVNGTFYLPFNPGWSDTCVYAVAPAESSYVVLAMVKNMTMYSKVTVTDGVSGTPSAYVGIGYFPSHANDSSGGKAPSGVTFESSPKFLDNFSSSVDAQYIADSYGYVSADPSVESITYGRSTATYTELQNPGIARNSIRRPS